MKSTNTIGAALLGAFLASTVPATSALPQALSSSRHAEEERAFSNYLNGLIRHDGTVFNRRQLAGKPTLIFFGFTSCGSVCPIALDVITVAMENIEKEYGAGAVPNLLFVTTLPTHEGADVVASYLKARGAHPAFVGLTAQQGIEALLDDPAALARVRQIEALTEGFSARANGHHSPLAYLMGGNGKYIRVFNTQHSGAELSADMAEVLKLKTPETKALTP